MESKFRKAVSPVTLAVNYLTGIFHGFWMKFFLHLCSRALRFRAFFSEYSNLFLYFFYYNSLNFLICIVKSLFWRTSYRLLYYLIVEHINKYFAKPLTSSFAISLLFQKKFFHSPSNYAKIQRIYPASITIWIGISGFQNY